MQRTGVSLNNNYNGSWPEQSHLTSLMMQKLVSAGKEAREVYKTFAWAAEGDKDKFDKVLEAFE